MAILGRSVGALTRLAAAASSTPAGAAPMRWSAAASARSLRLAMPKRAISTTAPRAGGEGSVE